MNMKTFYSMDLSKMTKADLAKIAGEMETNKSQKALATASEAQLLQADRTGKIRAVNAQKVQSTQISSCAAIGTEKVIGKHKRKNLGIHAKQDNSKVTDPSERLRLGMSNRDKKVDYSTRLVSGEKVKTCCGCQNTWNVSNFSKDAKTRDLLKDTCKDCGKRADASRIYIPVSKRVKVDS